MKSIGPFLGHLLGIGADSASIDSQAILIEVNLYSTGEFLPVISKEDSNHGAQPRRNPRRGCTGESSCARLEPASIPVAVTTQTPSRLKIASASRLTPPELQEPEVNNENAESNPASKASPPMALILVRHLSVQESTNDGCAFNMTTPDISHPKTDNSAVKNMNRCLPVRASYQILGNSTERFDEAVNIMENPNGRKTIIWRALANDSALKYTTGKEKTLCLVRPLNLSCRAPASCRDTPHEGGEGGLKPNISTISFASRVELQFFCRSLDALSRLESIRHLGAVNGRNIAIEATGFSPLHRRCTQSRAFARKMLKARTISSLQCPNSFSLSKLIEVKGRKRCVVQSPRASSPSMLQQEKVIEQPNNKRLKISNCQSSGIDDFFFVTPECLPNITDHMFLLICQAKRIVFSDEDKTNNCRKNKHSLSIGSLGMRCRHCVGKVSGVYFPTIFRNMQSSALNLHGHLLKCFGCPADVKLALKKAKALHESQWNELRGIESASSFWGCLFDRLRDKDFCGGGPAATELVRAKADALVERILSGMSDKTTCLRDSKTRREGGGDRGESQGKEFRKGDTHLPPSEAFSGSNINCIDGSNRFGRNLSIPKVVSEANDTRKSPVRRDVATRQVKQVNVFTTSPPLSLTERKANPISLPISSAVGVPAATNNLRRNLRTEAPSTGVMGLSISPLRRQSTTSIFRGHDDANLPPNPESFDDMGHNGADMNLNAEDFENVCEILEGVEALISDAVKTPPRPNNGTRAAFIEKMRGMTPIPINAGDVCEAYHGSRASKQIIKQPTLEFLHNLFEEAPTTPFNIAGTGLY